MNCPSCGSQKLEVRFRVVRYNFLMACPDTFHGPEYQVSKDGNEIALKNFFYSLNWKIRA